MRLFFFCINTLALCATLGASGSIAQGTVRITDLSGRKRILFSSIEKRPTVVLFLGHDCPISNKYSPEINRIIAKYGSRASIYIAYADPGLGAESAQKHVSEFGYRCPVILDSKHLLVKYAGATVTPEAAVFDRFGKLAYRGRIDDTYIDFGKRRDAPTRRDLRAALEAILNGRFPNPSITRAVGCFIPKGT